MWRLGIDELGLLVLLEKAVSVTKRPRRQRENALPGGPSASSTWGSSFLSGPPLVPAHRRNCLAIKFHDVIAIAPS
jgi:hypothetical protein